MKRYLIILLCAIFMAPVASMHAFDAPERAKESIALAKKAAALFKEKGKDYALKVINSKIALTDGELYVFALSMDNTMLAHPFMPSLIGKNVDDMKDSTGKKYFQEFKRVAEDPGQGWVEYMWNRPGEDDPRFKRSYIIKVPNRDIYIGSGYYPALPADKID